jgi:hypothetical protein
MYIHHTYHACTTIVKLVKTWRMCVFVSQTLISTYTLTSQRHTPSSGCVSWRHLFSFTCSIPFEEKNKKNTENTLVDTVKKNPDVFLSRFIINNIYFLGFSLASHRHSCIGFACNFRYDTHMWVFSLPLALLIHNKTLTTSTQCLFHNMRRSGVPSERLTWINKVDK